MRPHEDGKAYHQSVTTGPARGLGLVWRLVIVVSIPLTVTLLGVAWAADVASGTSGAASAVGLQDGQIVDVIPGGPADRAGLRPGDVILAVDGVSSSGTAAFHDAVFRGRAGEQRVYRIRRGNSGGSGSGTTLDVVVILEPRLSRVENLISGVVVTLVGVLFLAVGSVVGLARPKQPAARPMVVLGLAAASTAAADLWGEGVHDTQIDRLLVVCGTLTAAALLHLFLVFPVPHPWLARFQTSGRAGPWSTQLPIAAIYVISLSLTFGTTLGPFTLWPWTSGWISVVFALALGVLIQSYQRLKAPLFRSQVKWILWALSLNVLVLLLEVVVLVGTDGRLVNLIGQVILVPWILFPLALGASILRYRLFDIDVVIRRTLLYGVPTGCLAAIYVGSVVLLQGLFRLLVGQATDVAIVASTLAIAALFQPLRQRIQRTIDRRFYRQKYDARRTVAAFSAVLRDELDLAQLSERLVAVVEETMQPTRVSLWLRPASHGGKPNRPTS